ncbi:MAG: helix-turn-helix domain-containing protein [Proteobacteria bacterium]|nr:helix-turn-helix domain-containing protein [Pseudomonadota bacterium]
MEGTVTSRLAKRLKRLRQERQWSLDQLSERSSVSRATLSRLENGEVSPTTEALAKLCSAYGLTLSRLLLMVEEEFPPLVRKQDQSIWEDSKAGFTRRVVSPPAGPLAAEVVACELKAGVRIAYESPPVAGLEHHLYLTEGRLSIAVDGQTHELSTGDCLRYQLYGASEFRTPADSPAKYLLVMV